MNVQQLIDALEALPDKTKRVLVDDGQCWWAVKEIDDGNAQLILLS